MPELPEVETVRRGLAPVMEGALIARVETRRPDLRFPLPKDFIKRITGAQIGALDRRGKYLLAPLSSGEVLIMHLGMSGRFALEASGAGVAVGLAPRKSSDPRHDHVVFHLTSATGTVTRVVYNDPRRFGFMDLASADRLEECRHFKGMGPEPLGNSFSPTALASALKSKKALIKTALLNQRVVAGLGNIYVCEALFRAGVSPRRRAGSIAGQRGERLYRAIVDVLNDAIDAGGSTLRDFAAVDGDLGYFQHKFEVYGREGEECRRCGALIKRLEQGGRSTFFCCTCQR